MQEYTTPKAQQSLARAITADEQQLSDALFAIFGTGTHDFEAVARELETRRIPRPSGASGAWTVAVLEDELRRINASLDDAYARGLAKVV